MKTIPCKAAFLKDRVTMMTSVPTEECLLNSSLVQEVYMLSKFGEPSSSRRGDYTLYNIQHYFKLLS